MKASSTALARRYQASLRTYLQRGPQASVSPARRLGREAIAGGWETLDLARIHEQALIRLMADCSARSRPQRIKRAGLFFAEAITPIETTHRTARETAARLHQLNQDLRQRRRQLAAANRRLRRQAAQRQRAERALRKREQQYSRLWEESRRLQEQLRSLSRQILFAQEEERKRISRELHDRIAQTLTGITLRLAALKKEATTSNKDLQKQIARTQQLVEQSVDIVHRFARELRPRVLDELGLIPALQSFVKSFAAQTGLRVRLTVAAAAEQLDGAKRTTLYRVAQEALTNVARHARATQVEVVIRQLAGSVCLRIRDNGRSFPVQRVLQAPGNKRLGLLGMRERVEMVGGRFHIDSAAGQGTTVRARIPWRSRATRRTTGR